MHKTLNLGLMLAAVATLTACSSVPTVSLGDYPREATLPPADILPTEAQISDHARLKVIVFNSEDGGLRAARDSQATHTLTSALESTLGSNGVEIVDRSLAGRLDNEIKLAEIKGMSNSDEGPAVANFAIKSVITQADYGSEYVPATSWTDKKGKTHTNPAYYSHNAATGIMLKIYAIPSLREIKTIAGKGSNSDSTNDGGNRGASMIRNATQDALFRVQDQLLNLFAPKGYVLRRMTTAKGDKSVFQISIGAQHGLVPGQKMVVKTQREARNPITGKISHEDVEITSASVSTLVSPSEAWIVPESEEAAANIRLGDVVEVRHEKLGALDLVMKRLK